MTKDEKQRQADRMERWVVRYLLTHTEASCLNEDFHEEFHKEFGGKRKETMFGSQPVAAAMKTLKELARKGVADSHRINLGVARQPGFPNWVNSYSISKFGREIYGKRFTGPATA